MKIGAIEKKKQKLEERKCNKKLFIKKRVKKQGCFINIQRRCFFVSDENKGLRRHEISFQKLSQQLFV